MLFIDRSGQGVVVHAKPRRRKGRHVHLTPTEELAYRNAYWASLRAKGMTLQDIADRHKVQPSTVMWGVESHNRSRSAQEGRHAG